MPEGLEAEIWRAAIEVTVGRTIIDAWVDERVAPPGFVSAVRDLRITAVRRAGKVVLVDTDGPTIGLHFGMTGRVVVDGSARDRTIVVCVRSGRGGVEPAVAVDRSAGSTCRRFGSTIRGGSATSASIRICPGSDPTCS